MASSVQRVTSPKISPMSPTSPLAAGMKRASSTILPSAKRRRRDTYTYKDVHDDLENGKYSGAYGWDNAAFIAIAGTKAGLDLENHHGKISPDEHYIPELKELIDNPATQEHWHRIVTFDPFGMTATIPTIGCTTAVLNLPEVQPEPDGVVVNEDRSINVIKAGVSYTWNLPGLSERLELEEDTLRNCLHQFSRDDRLKDPSLRVHLPQVGGLTVYIFGDPRKIRDPLTEIAVRVHDECNGSDVFGTDICTCRPYLVFALNGCVEVAQRGGVGVFVYFRKEGRSLGEVTKYRVYNARKNQEGGDCPEKYFFHTEKIAGVRDARFQGMMPDVLNWLGIHRIDWLFSMSNEKYDALVAAGIRIYQRVPLPIQYVPKGAHIELSAKIADGYKALEVEEDETMETIRNLRQVRKQCHRVLELAQNDKCVHFKLQMENFDKTVTAVTDCIEECYPDLNIPPHSRFRHFDDDDMSKLETQWHHLSQMEKVRRLIDLATVSVLLDAGAGANWKFTKSDGSMRTRSEGLACASFQMFLDGEFSSDPALKTRVNSVALKKLDIRALTLGFQVTAGNQMTTGIKGRAGLLNRLGSCLEASPEFFGHEVYRPGNVVDYVCSHVVDGKVSIEFLWKAIIEGLEAMWPTHVSGIQRGDVWGYNPLKIDGQPGSDLIPFHKLSQWLILSWLEPLQTLDFEIVDLHLLTCLAEYRNGGLIMDTGLVALKDDDEKERAFNVGSELVVEWRALTLALMDGVATKVREYFGKSEEEMPFAMILEGGTWKAGRRLAYKKRGGKPPILLRSDGTVF